MEVYPHPMSLIVCLNVYTGHFDNFQLMLKSPSALSTFKGIIDFVKPSSRTVLSWQVRSSEDITENSLRLFKLLEPKIDLLVIGLESNDRTALGIALKAARASAINVEVLPTEHACSTFNFLNAEGRCVAGAFIPPLTVEMTADDLLQNKLHYNNLYQHEMI
ncbi:hypothetical protein evm_003167 [Chilo suppressalis]|nr:hypothetical protein evm_003167 [Chilo suppressalis]